MKTLTFGYIRRSSYKQQENNSVEIQKAHIQEFAKRKGMEIPEDFIFIEDVTSAFSKRASKRKELMRLQQMMIETNIPRVIFYEESRMDRTGYTFVLDFYRPLSEKLPNVEVYTTNSEEPFNPDSPQTKIALLLYRQESEIKSDRALGSLIADLEGEVQIRPGAKVPYGYDQVNKKLIPNENAEIVTLIYYLHSWGKSFAKIASILTQAKIPSPSGKKTWRPSSVEKILKNPVYTGNLTWTVNKDKGNSKPFEFPDFNAPLIDEFYLQLSKNNTKLQNEYGRLETPYLFLNKLFCKLCHDKMQTDDGSTTRNGKKYYYKYYECKNCNYKVEANHVHEHFLPKIIKHLHNLVTSEGIKSSTFEYLTNIEEVLHSNINKLIERINVYSEKGAIANENGDRELEMMVEKLQSKSLVSLQSCRDSLGLLDELIEAVHSDIFFERFNQILQFQLGELEKRLIILYIVEKIFVSPHESFQVFYKQNIFESFNLLHSGQSTET